MESEPREVDRFQRLVAIWWPAAGAAALVSVGAAVVFVLHDQSVTATAVLATAAGVLIAGVPRASRVSAILAFLAVLVWYVVTEHFDDEFRTAMILAAVAGVSTALSGVVANRRQALRSELNELFDRAEKRSIRDAVEEALAARRLDNYVEREFTRAQRYGREVTVAVAEIDNLELLRRERGPEAVRDMLVTLGELFSNDSRLPDGGLSEELRLVFVLPETPLLGGRVVAERVRLNFQQLRQLGADQVPMTVSVGVASYPVDGELVPEVIGAAESALRRAVSAGGNRTMLSRSPAGTPAGWSGLE